MTRFAGTLILAAVLAASAGGAPASVVKAGTEFEFYDIDELVREIHVLKVDGTWTDDVLMPPGDPWKAGRVFIVPEDGPCVRQLEVVSATPDGDWTQDIDLCDPKTLMGVTSKPRIAMCDVEYCDGQ